MASQSRRRDPSIIVELEIWSATVCHGLRDIVEENSERYKELGFVGLHLELAGAERRL